VTCIPFKGGFICVTPFYRLRLLDGRYVYMAWHSFCGPMFFHDRGERREIKEWYKDALICRALEWFQGRGHLA